MMLGKENCWLTVIVSNGDPGGVTWPKNHVLVSSGWAEDDREPLLALQHSVVQNGNEDSNLGLRTRKLHRLYGGIVVPASWGREREGEEEEMKAEE